MKDKQTTRQIIRDRSLPGSEQISRHQDFTRLSQDYTMIKKLLAKKIMLWSGGSLLGIAAVTGLLLLNSTKEVAANKEVAAFATIEEVKEAFVQPPFPGHETPYTVYRISAKNGGVIHYPTGSVLTIPPNSFYSKDGKPLSDSIDIKYREFHDPLSIFLAGIPMHYDSAGVHNTLESAGMLEIRAFDNGKDLNLREDAPIHVKMASATNDTRHNLYELDTLLRNWVYRGKDKVEEFNKKNKKQVAAKKETAQPAAPELVKPALSDPNKFSFRIAYDKNEFPELAAYEHVLFEVTDHDFKPAYFKINWNKISLYSGTEPGRYQVSLKKADTTISVNAKPVFDRENYDAAIEEFELRHQQASKQRDEEEFKKQEALNEVNKDLETYSSAYMLNALARQANMPYARLFSIRSLGYHNMDFPITPNMQYAFNVKQVVDESRKQEAEKRAGSRGDASKYNTIFLVEQGKNTVFRFSRNEPVRCDPKAKNLMWTLTDKNEIAFFRIADYTKLVNGGENRITPVVAPNQTLAFAEIRKFTQEGK